MRPFLSACGTLLATLTYLGPEAGSVSSQLLAREPWTGSQVVGTPDPPQAYTIERVYPHLSFNQPVELLPLADSGRMLLLELSGRVLTFEDNPQCTQADLALDLVPLSDAFSQALGIAVHPDFKNNRQIFVCYASKPMARPDGTRLSRFRMTADSPPRIDPNSEEILLTWPSGGHNGCAIRFDSSGYLYFSTGDGARPFPPDEYNVSQDLSDLRSTICRIDVDRPGDGRGYAIPPDNPFLEIPNARPEIWAYGFRNPWRFTIDHASGKLFCGDVGWELWELVHDVQRGGNHGWSIFEGPQPIRSDIAPGPSPIIKPLIAYPHSDGLSVTGGIVYHGHDHPELQGAFLYGDYVTGLLWGVRTQSVSNSSGKPAVESELNGNAFIEWNHLLAETGLKIITMAAGRDGEVLLVSFDGGIYRLIKNEVADQSKQFPRLLSQTGIFSEVSQLELATGVLPYTLAAPAWQAGGQLHFAIGVPERETILPQQQQRNWKYPPGTVFVKTISLPWPSGQAAEERKIETQLLHFDGLTWQPYTYAWNAQQSDAELVDAEGATITLQLPPTESSQSGESLIAKKQESLPWRFQSRGECRACHSNQTGGAVGFTLANLQSIAGQIVQDPLSALKESGLVDSAPRNLETVQRMVAPLDPQAPLELRARSYLAANCAHCHSRGGGGTAALELSFSNPTAETFAINFPATQGTFDIPGGKVIVPGNPYHSILYYRLATSGTGHMPKLWTRDNDSGGLELIHDWIESLGDGSAVTPAANAGPPVPEALRWVHQMEQTGDPEVRRQQALQALSTAGPLTRGLYERFLQPSERIPRLGSDVDVNFFLTSAGDAERGRDRFLNSPAQQCRNCHRIAERGRALGPDLNGIGKKRSRAELLESLLEPSLKIEPQFATWSVVTTAGEVITGLKVAEDDDHLLIRATDGSEYQIANEDIEQTAMQAHSSMPMGLVSEMTAEELSDLLAFLCSLK